MFSKECAPFYIPTKCATLQKEGAMLMPCLSEGVGKDNAQRNNHTSGPRCSAYYSNLSSLTSDHSLECNVFIHMISGLSRNSIPASINNGLMFYLLSVIVSFVFYFI